jgi:hypothetical protein
MKPRSLPALAIIILVLAAGCGTLSPPTAAPATPMPPTGTPTATATPIPPTETPTATTTSLPPTETPSPTATSAPPTETPTVTATPVLPTFTPMPPTATPQPATHTVCEAGCSFATLQAAIDRLGATGEAIIEISDPIHTEAGITVSQGTRITIRGLGATSTIVQAHETLEDAPDRVFFVEKGAHLTLENLTIRHGRPAIESEHGGGILNRGTLIVKNCVVSDNSARGGGGISSRQATLTIIGSTIRDNVARGDGPRGEQCGGGGGVKCSSGTMMLIDSAIVDNQAGIRSEGLGGGVRTGCGCTAEIVNCTISGNKAKRYGGGIAAAGTVHITHCTVSNNAVGHGGGALWIRGQVDIENTIVANNHGGVNCTLHDDGFAGKGSIGVNRNNLIEDGSCDADLHGDPKLGPLDDNGGGTLTHALLAGSPAIDVVPAAECSLPTDQRGSLRPIVQASLETPCDIGAFEVQAETH